MQRNPLAPAVILATTLLATSALAATQTKSGEVRSTDTAKHELVLTSGETFETVGAVKLDQFKSGQKVTVTYEMKDGKMLASKVRATQ